MTDMGILPVPEAGYDNIDYAAKLVRVRKGAERAAGGSSFEETLSSALRNNGGPSHSVREKAGKAEREQKRLWDACVEMESLLVGNMMKEMRKTVEKTGWINGGPAEEIFEDMLYDEYSLGISRNSNLGLAKMLYEDMKRRL
jgi:Rod binding domain-containing protein